jgi:glutamyl-Q tRNA(Asp) synthetase
VTTPPVFRFAPSPNGRLHLGHAYSALCNLAAARAAGGRFLVRIEDIDIVRCTPALVEAALSDLAWLGIRSDCPVRRQSAHLPLYGRHAQRLRELGLLYPCLCTRAQILRAVATQADHPRDPEGAPLYPGTCRCEPPSDERLTREGSPAWRLDMGKALAAAGLAPLVATMVEADGSARVTALAPSRWGDVVIVRKDIGTSYHLSVVADDALQGVTDVVRGTDLEAATSIHVLLQRLLGLPVPRYRHHGLVLDDGGEKLAKSRGSVALADLRAAGVTPEEIRRELGFPADLT